VRSYPRAFFLAMSLGGLTRDGGLTTATFALTAGSVALTEAVVFLMLTSRPPEPAVTYGD